MADIRAIVFDFDGVLANSEPLHLLSYQAVLDELGIALGREEYYTHLLGFDDVMAFKTISERRGERWSEAKIAGILERKTVIFDDIIASRASGDVLYPEAVPCVRRLAETMPLGIASGALRLVLQTEDDNDAALRLYADSGYAMIKGYCSLMLPLDP